MSQFSKMRSALPNTRPVAPPSPDGPRPYLSELDGLRAIAVWAVVLYHIGVSFIPGAYGVVLFFVLSGYLITLMLFREFGRSGSIDIRAFFLRRALRIMPAFYCYLAFVVALKTVRGNPVNWGHLASAATYTVDYYNAWFGDPNSGFSHAWSLAIEEKFYLIWPFAFLYLARNSSGISFTRKIGAAVAVTIAMRTFLKLTTALPQSYYYSAFEMRLDAILVGACAAIISVHWPTGISTALDRWDARRLMIGAFMMTSLLAFLEWRLGDGFRDIVVAALLPALCAITIMAAVRLGDQRRLTLLDSGPLTWLGRLSYSTYLYQQLVPGLGVKLVPQGSRLWQLGAECAIALTLACCSYYLIERPILRFKNRIPVQHNTPHRAHA